MSHILKHHGYSSAFGINSIAIYNTLLTIVPMRVPIHKFNSDILAGYETRALRGGPLEK